jgi:RHS repeat-associated protein
MSGATLLDNTPIRYGYDAEGRRVQSVVGTQTTQYLWDEGSTYGDVIAEFDGTGNLRASYVLGNGQLISQKQNGAISYYNQDALGSTRALTDASGSVTDTYNYNAFGSIYSQTGSTTNFYRFAGQQSDALTGLYDMHARYYDPLMGGFLSRDTAPFDYSNPIELNRYGYTCDGYLRYPE